MIIRKVRRGFARFVPAGVAAVCFTIATAAAQPQPTVKVGDRVEVDVNMSSSAQYQSWKTGTVKQVDLQSAGYWVSIEDGVRSRDVIIPIRSPDLWIRAAKPESKSLPANAGAEVRPAAPARQAGGNQGASRENAAAQSAPAPKAPAAPVRSAPRAAGPFKLPADCVVGAKVTDRQNKTGTITAVSGSMCSVALDGSGEKKSYIFWMLQPAGGAQSASAEALPAGTYKCYSLAGATLNYMFMDIVIDGPGTYRDKQGKSGKYRLEPSGQIIFESGPFTQSTAKLLPGPKIGINQNGGTFFNTTCGM